MTFQEWAVRLPARLCGWGFRSLKDSCGPAYIGALETALPYMAGIGKICPQLQELWGDEEYWGAGTDQEQRWRRVIESDCSAGKELLRSWGRIRLEASNTATWLGEEIPKILASRASEVGEGSVSSWGWRQ